MTRQYKLGQIATVDLRDVWPHEVLDFTKWLSENENLEILSEAVGIELELVETESSVGSFNVDIFADEVGTGRKVIIENQLEGTVKNLAHFSDSLISPPSGAATPPAESRPDSASSPTRSRPRT